MEPMQSFESAPPENPPTTTTSVTVPSLSHPGDDNQADDNLKQVEEEDPPTQNPSNPAIDSEPVQSSESQALAIEDPDPLNPSNFTESANPDHSLQEQESTVVVDEQDLEEQEGMALSPSHQPLVSDAHVEERDNFPPLSSSRRAPPKRKKGSAKNNPRKLAAIEKKVQALTQNFKAIPFVPGKTLDFSRHEENMRRLGLWDFANLEFDRKMRDDLVAKLIVGYNEKTRCSYIDNVRVMVNQADLARALNLSSKKPVDCGEETWPVDFVSFVDDFVSNWMLLHEDTWILPSEVLNWTRVIKEGHPEKVDWARLIWFMVKRELARGTQLVNCYYASHLQHLIKVQREELLKENPEEVEEIVLLKEDDEEEESDVKMTEGGELPHGGEPEMNPESMQLSLGQEGNVGTDNVPSNQSMGNVDDVDGGDNVGDGENVDSLDHHESTADCVGHVENVETAGNHVENLETASVHVENLKTAGAHGENLETAGDHVENADIADDHVENMETAEIADDHVENAEIADDHVENAEIAEDHVENAEIAEDHVENAEIADDDVENKEETASDHAENLETAGDRVENLETAGDLLENMETASDHVEAVKIAGYHVGSIESAGDHAEDMKTDDDDVGKADHVQIQQIRGNDMMDFEDCKVEEQVQWDLSGKDGEQEQFLRQCTMNEVRVDEELTRQDGQGEEAEDDEAEDDERVEGFDTLQKGNSFNGLTMEPSQIPYTSDFGDQSSLELLSSRVENHVMLGGPSIFGNAPKREIDHDSDISHLSLNDNHKRMRTEGPSWDQKPPDFDFCIDQMQQWVAKARMAYVTSQQTIMNQQQLIFNELGAKDHLIQQLRSNIEELQKRRQAELARYDNELYAMSSVINGYRRALKSTQQAFAEYRKRSSLPAEPLYKDAGDGGVVKSIMDLEKEHLKREEEERVARIMFTETVEKLGNEWGMAFEGHLERVGMYQTRVSNIEKDVELLKESMGKRKASKTADCTDSAP